MKKNPAAVIRGMSSALVSGGVLALECVEWLLLIVCSLMCPIPQEEQKKLSDTRIRFHRMGGHLNVVGIRSALHAALAEQGIDATAVDPWYFPTPASYSKLLLANGFEKVTAAYLMPRPTPLPKPAGLAGFLEVRPLAALLSCGRHVQLSLLIDGLCSSLCLSVSSSDFRRPLSQCVA